jgi:hypothetical protein
MYHNFLNGGGVDRIGCCVSCTRRGFQSPTEATGMSPNTRMKIKMHLESHPSKTCIKESGDKEETSTSKFISSTYK